MVLTRRINRIPQKKTPEELLWVVHGFWVYQWPTQWLRLGRLVGDARFVNEWKIETAEPTKTRVLEVVGCFSVMFVWEGWWNTTRVFWSKLISWRFSVWFQRCPPKDMQSANKCLRDPVFTDARWMCLEPQPSEYSRGTWQSLYFPIQGWLGMVVTVR